MKKIAAALVASALAALALMGPASPAAAVDGPIPTEAPYPPTVCDLQLSKTRVAPGETFTATVTADQPTTITVSYEDQSFSEDDTLELVATFTAPSTTSTRTTQVVAACGDLAAVSADVVVAVGDGGAVDAAGDADADAGDASGILPETGGTDFWLLLLGALLLAAGVGAVVQRRRSS
jgi:LPXTG-motif cell wall-anchored protein